MSEVPRQFSPSTRTRPRPVPGSIRSDTTPTRPTSASTLVLISRPGGCRRFSRKGRIPASESSVPAAKRSEEHTSELQSQSNLVCRLLLEKKKKHQRHYLISPHRATYIASVRP